MGHLLESHLLKKSARHQNLDCSTLFEQMPKIMKLLELQLLDKNIEKCQLLELKKVESLEHVRQFG